MTANHLSEIALANPIIQEIDTYKSISQKVKKSTNFYIAFVLGQATKIAKEGYGSCIIKIDQSVDLGYMGIDDNHCNYSLVAVVKILTEKGFTLEQKYDYYDAISYDLVWNKDLLQSPKKIGISY